MINELIPENILQRKDQEIGELIKSSDQVYAIAIDDELYGPAFRHYLLFSRWPYLLKRDVPDLDAQIIFYNAYYWFVKFSKLYMAKHGYDTGLEQQAFQILENADFNIDWVMIEQIEHQVEEETEELVK
jgi:hypothetical protein